MSRKWKLANLGKMSLTSAGDLESRRVAFAIHRIYNGEFPLVSSFISHSASQAIPGLGMFWGEPLSFETN